MRDGVKCFAQVRVDDMLFPYPPKYSVMKLLCFKVSEVFFMFYFQLLIVAIYNSSFVWQCVRIIH